MQELAGLIGVGSGELIRHLMVNMGVMATMTQSIDVSVAKQLVEVFGKTLADEGIYLFLKSKIHFPLDFTELNLYLKSYNSNF